MIYIVADSLKQTSAVKRLLGYPKAVPLVHHNNIRGHRFTGDDTIYIWTNDSDKILTLLPALCGCHIFNYDINLK